jgi:hypothetical protein
VNASRGSKGVVKKMATWIRMWLQGFYRCQALLLTVSSKIKRELNWYSSRDTTFTLPKSFIGGMRGTSLCGDLGGLGWKGDGPSDSYWDLMYATSLCCRNCKSGFKISYTMSSKLTQTWNNSNTGWQRTHPNVHPSKTQQGSAPVRPVWSGLLGMNITRGSTPPNPNPDLPNRSTYLCKTLGIVGTPHGETIAKFMSTKTCQIKRNRRNSTKNPSNPRASKTPKSSPLTHGFGRGIKGKRTMKGSQIHPPPNPQEQGPKNTPRNPWR